MTRDRDHDGVLHEAFAELRREDTAHAPSFDAVVQRTSGATTPVPLRGGALAAGMLAAALVVGLLVRRPALAPPPAAATLAWTAPTDFLLRTPGIEVLESVPHIAPRRSLLALDGAAAAMEPKRRSPSP
jgi:hypothetical protein